MSVRRYSAPRLGQGACFVEPAEQCDTRRAMAIRALACAVLLVASVGDACAQDERSGEIARDRPRDATTAPSPSASAPLSINGVLRGGAQWIVSPARAKDDVFGYGALDVIVTARPTPHITLLVDGEGYIGPGPNQALGTLSNVNADAGRTEGAQTRFALREAWVRLESADANVRFNVGKLDVTHYFDGNAFAASETRQFLNDALVRNPVLREPPNGPGAAVRVSHGDWRYAFGVHAPDAIDGDLSGLPYVIGELGRRNIFSQRGQYRWWARVGSVPEQRDDVTWGTGVSIDQLVSENIGVFLRAGLSRSDGEALTSHAWSLGVQHAPDWLGRPKDVLGIGYAFQHESAGRERIGEIYYNVSLADWCQIIANVEWIFSGPNQVTGRRNRDVVVPGLRALILF